MTEIEGGDFAYFLNKMLTTGIYLLLCCWSKKHFESKMKIGEVQMIIWWIGQSCEETTAGDSQGKWKWRGDNHFNCLEFTKNTLTLKMNNQSLNTCTVEHLNCPGKQEDVTSSEDPWADGQPEHLWWDRSRY